MNTNTKLGFEKQHGVIDTYNFSKGYGFIRNVDSTGLVTTYFLHVSKIQSGIPQVGAACLFHIGDLPLRGTARPALNVEVGELVRKFVQPTEGGK